MRYTIENLRRDIVFEEELRGIKFKFHSTWGLFSPEHVDIGTRLLINELEIKNSDVSLDLGCGYGPVGLVMAKLAPEGHTHLIDKDFVAIEYAKKNADANGITNFESYLSNGFNNIPKNLLFDIIASNLPAKPSKELYWILFNDAKERLKPGGKLYVVVISGLKEFIKRNFSEIFGNYKKLKQGKSHTVLMAEKLK